MQAWACVDKQFMRLSEFTLCQGLILPSRMEGGNQLEEVSRSGAADQKQRDTIKGGVDYGQVEPLRPPEGSQPGERVFFGEGSDNQPPPETPNKVRNLSPAVRGREIYWTVMSRVLPSQYDCEPSGLSLRSLTATKSCL